MSKNCFPAILHVAVPLLVLSFVSNLAILINPLFMMQVLDRVIPSGNMATLLLLAGLALTALALQAVVEASRDLALGRLSRWVEQSGTELALSPTIKSPGQLIRHVASLSSFIGGSGATAALSLPWIPVFALVLWLLHPAFLGLLVGMALLFIVTTLASQSLASSAQTSAGACAEAENTTLQRIATREREPGSATIIQNLRNRFFQIQKVRHLHADDANRTGVAKGLVTGFLRNAGQICALGIGAGLVTVDLLSAGGMIAASIITSKAYGAIEAALTHVPSIRIAVSDYFALARWPMDQKAEETVPDAPSGVLRAEGLISPRGGGAPPRLDRISLTLGAGECLAIVGSSSSGKSTLLRCLAGVDPAPIGSVFLDENEIRGLTQASLHRMVGYLAQGARFQHGTIAENISSFEDAPSSEAIVRAAKVAGVYGLICALPDSFETDIGAQPYVLSAGQSQRLALAQAIYKEPRYLFLDEPNTLLDAEGERALGQTILRLKAAGTTIVMVVQRSGVLNLADKVLHLNQGRMSDFGNRSEVMARLGLGGRQIELPLLVSSAQDLRDWLASHFTRAGDEEFSQKVQTVGEELFHVALFNLDDDKLHFARFVFKFINETQCEIAMCGPSTEGIDEKFTRIQNAGSSKTNGPHVLAQDEQRLAHLCTMSERFQVEPRDEQTEFRVILSSELGAPVSEKKAS